MDLLIVKLSSLGDVVHTLPVVHDLRDAFPDARIDWVVERGFAPLVRRCAGIDRVIPCDLRRWRKAPFARETRVEWRAFREDLKARAYEAVVDLQGLTKSALVARMATLAPGGRRYAMANATDGSSYERPTRWVADVAIPLEQQLHAVERAREVCARAFGYALSGAPRYGLARAAGPREDTVVLVHGTSREDKCWPEDHWLELGQRLLAQGHALALPHGNEAEEKRSRRIAAALGPRAEVWPRLSLDALTQRMARCAGTIGVDSGLSHIAVALDLPHVQVYNFDTAWRTGPLGNRRQQAVYARPTPSVDAVWHAWQGVTMAG
ncbi:lipopolysaccharide heptosyltransferase I [Ramlibacter sp. USB13]|uniref:Lipopolysaccharide heptosyltransferase 1 n=1 Tax=Ramlibacter cellulosilyticus TaxID=2764187 RepID=A0A923MR88_9BURK|nr:lipopolysaccharide heptosyltransferase I [Ramlibacter cellulosilyticus]MBC5784352.1 lipopolysaccharide heptosyltransferase I [Ramlibacter cellulosilyticus]